jgi:hypothetical protein
VKRWIFAFCLLVVSALGILVPAGAQASTVTAGKLTSGKPVKATISTPGQQVKYTFAATANKNVTFNITHFNFTNNGSPGEVFIDFYEPGSSSIYAQCNNGVVGNTYCNFTTPVSGTWKVALVPFQASVGSLTLTFANDVPAKALTPGTPVTTTIKFAGQHAGYTFAATANRTVTFNVTNFHFTNNGSPGEVFIDFYEPRSSSIYAQCNNGVVGNTTCSLKTPVGGTWKAELVPFQASIGSLTLKLT